MVESLYKEKRENALFVYNRGYAQVKMIKTKKKKNRKDKRVKGTWKVVHCT